MALLAAAIVTLRGCHADRNSTEESARETGRR
jgi:hypothetical protein